MGFPDNKDSDMAPTCPRKATTFQLEDMKNSLEAISNPGPNKSMSFDIRPDPEQVQPEYMAMMKKWMKHTKKRLLKEYKDSQTQKRVANFHQALQHSFDLAEIKTDVNEISTIKIREGDDMNDDNTLKKIWTQTIILPSTKLPEPRLTGQPIPTQHWTGQFLLTREEKVDQLYYEALHKEAWQCGRTELGFQDWIDQQGITQLMTQQGLQMDYPGMWYHHTIILKSLADFLIFKWEDTFFKTKITYEPWHGIMEKSIPLPKEGTWENWITSSPLATTSTFKMNYTDNELLRAPPKTPKKEANKPIQTWKDDTFEDTPEKEEDENMSTSSKDWAQEVDKEIPMDKHHNLPHQRKRKRKG